MDNKSIVTSPTTNSLPVEEGTRRKRRSGHEIAVRYFLPKSGSSVSNPDLGQELASEGEALIQAFKSGQPFYSVAVWKAVPEVENGRPLIVKQAAAAK
jgi:hypothetical protein